MGQLHKPLIADLSDCIILIELFIEPGNGIIPGHCLLKFLLTVLLFLQKLLVGLSGQQFSKGIFVVTQIFCHPPQLQHHHLLNGREFCKAPLTYFEFGCPFVGADSSQNFSLYFELSRRF